MDKTQTDNAYMAGFSQTFLTPEEYEVFDLSLSDDKLDKLLVSSLENDTDYWNKAPWNLQEVDKQNVKFYLGEQFDSKWVKDNDSFIDNRLFSSVRAILSYATGQLAVPEITPSRGDEQYVHMARMIQAALYQHSLNENVDQKTRSAVANLILRKRGYLKLRFDPNAGAYGDIVTEVCNPEDIIIDRTAGYLQNPNKIYHRIRCSVEELITRFPKKEAQIKRAYSIKQGRFTQISQYVTYFECWFTYMDSKGIPREAVCWFINNPDTLILDKMPNPNWVYTGDDKNDKQQNITSVPPKPFVAFNYLNLGHSYIDETCLFEQARPQQELLNNRQRQFHQNVDYMNGRWVASKKAFSEEDANKLVNKGPKTVAMTKFEDVNKAIAVLTPTGQPQQVFQSIIDARSEIDGIMGTPSIFKGADPQSQDTLGRDMMVKQQAGMLQDDLVRAVSKGMEIYYQIKLQLMRTYYTEDYWFQVKGGDGKFDFIMLNGDLIDANVKIGVQVDSTLPLDKQMIRANAMGLAKMRLIDPLTLFEDMGLPNPEVRAERLLRSQLDGITYLQSIEQQMDNNDAEVDVMLLTAGKEPQERDNYDEGYLNYFNHFMTTNRFSMLPQDAKQRVVQYLVAIQHLAAQSAQLQGSMLDDAGMLSIPVAPPAPRKDINVSVQGAPLDATQTAQLTGASPQPPPMV